MESFDRVVMGGGTAGLVTASGSAQLGAKVSLIEGDKRGVEYLRIPKIVKWWLGKVHPKAS